MDPTQYNNFIDEHPELTTIGFGVDHNYNYDHKTEHDNLKNHYEAFLVCLDMIQNGCELTKNKKARIGSYTLKHQAERYSRDVLKQDTYVPEGAFVAAVVYLDLPYKRSKENKPGIFMNLRAISRV
jgi:hypothetical protein